MLTEEAPLPEKILKPLAILSPRWQSHYVKNPRLLQLLRSAGAVLLVLSGSFLVFSCAGGPERKAQAVQFPEAVPDTPEVPVKEEPRPTLRESAVARLMEAPLLPESRKVALRVFPRNARVLAPAPDDSSGTTELQPEEINKEATWYSTNATMLLLEAPGYLPQLLQLPIPATGQTGQTGQTVAETAAQPAQPPAAVEAKLESESRFLALKAELTTPWQPKSVRFAPDGKSVFTANLGSPVPLSEYRINPPYLELQERPLPCRRTHKRQLAQSPAARSR